MESIWEAPTLTWAARPTSGEQLATVDLLAGEMVEVGLTNLVQGWSDASTPNYRATFTPPGGNYVTSIASSEHGHSDQVRQVAALL